MIAELSRRQRDMLLAIRSFVAKHGYAPTVRELGDLLGITSTNGVADHLKYLARKGCIERGAKGKARTLRITDRGHLWLKWEAA